MYGTCESESDARRRAVFIAVRPFERPRQPASLRSEENSLHHITSPLSTSPSLATTLNKNLYCSNNRNSSFWHPWLSSCDYSLTMRTSPTVRYATASVAAPPPSLVQLHHPRFLPPHLLHVAACSTGAIYLSLLLWFLLWPHVLQCRPRFIQHLLATQPRSQMLLSRYIHNLGQ